MIKLTYNLVNDEFKWHTFLGDPKSIANLYWQLSHNYQCFDGTKIKDVFVSNLDGEKIDNIMFESRFIPEKLSKYYPRSCKND